MEAKLSVVVVECRVELVSPMDPAAINDHHDVFAGFAEGRHHLMHLLAQLLGIKVRHDFRENLGGAILDRPKDTEQHATGHTAPRTIADPRLAFEGFVAVDLTLAQWACGEARALCFAPPARAGQGKAPQDRFVFIEHNKLAPAGPVLQGGELERSPRQLSGVGIEPPRGAAVVYVFFFKTSRTLSRLSWTPVWRAKTVARS